MSKKKKARRKPTKKARTYTRECDLMIKALKVVQDSLIAEVRAALTEILSAHGAMRTKLDQVSADDANRLTQIKGTVQSIDNLCGKTYVGIDHIHAALGNVFVGVSQRQKALVDKIYGGT